MTETHGLPIHEEFSCHGYYGFGNGVELVRLRRDQQAPTDALYCGRCPLAESCWAKHRNRVRRIVPHLMEVLDGLTAAGLRGTELLQSYSSKISELSGQAPNGELLPPPELNVMVGNLEDGGLIAAGHPPKDRAEHTLRYPFEFMRVTRSRATGDGRALHKGFPTVAKAAIHRQSAGVSAPWSDLWRLPARRG